MGSVTGKLRSRGKAGQKRKERNMGTACPLRSPLDLLACRCLWAWIPLMQIFLLSWQRPATSEQIPL
ncbi:hypothetical protein MUK42_35894 [Musa troglodytarum]|uniref:Uncharacterized protein n=1 Tax=Musa troglodytarum TaxID=320322 RepID=A0A9E7LAH2_9LILI|nr:hypothetical protein MUK42_32526 [Musa troglodytarum]URE46520.1 hypothetical protein MUK42_35894 [Musa troglodytarum]